jgi:prepilin-type N-terminal cleavage/methylation domain-containing protein
MDRLTNRTAARARGGFTLVEVMLAVVLLAIGLMSMLALQMHAMRGSQLGRHYTDASQVARDEMERLLQLDWDHADLGLTAWTAPDDEAREVQIDGEPNTVEQVYWVSRRITAGPDPDVRMIDVRVTWFEANDDPGAPPRRRYAISSARFDYD